ncbi:hypothetical protein LshimejAT787_0604370 [Lyophyllum shimeji]|uniref:Retrotransposon gag domain-containing protein n=1 Tax=Lyophyllum shimeji TaxID=47721 RepID=A0A9P3PNS3_LYOSH|nr:hypothetical protein LshimejAT787_0604370 [Lyophyllum shimeji]
MTNPPTLDHSVDEHPMTDTTSTEHAPTAGPGAADLIQLLHSISATQAQMLAYIEDRRRTTEGESRVAEPDKYNGNPKALDRFLMQLHLVFRSKPTTYADPNKRIIYALSFMKEGRAEKWAQGVLKRLEAGEVEWATWKDFEDEVRAAFQSGNARDDAQIQLERLQQGSRSAEDYFTEFEVYQHDSGYNDSALVRVLKRNLHPRLLEAIYNMNTLPGDDDFKGWKDLAIRKDRQRRELQMLLPTSNTSRPLDFRERDGLRGRDRGNFTDRGAGRTTPGTPNSGSPQTTAPSSTSSPANANTSGTFSGAGVPMEIDRAREGLLAVSSATTATKRDTWHATAPTRALSEFDCCSTL